MHENRGFPRQMPLNDHWRAHVFPLALLGSPSSPGPGPTGFPRDPNGALDSVSHPGRHETQPRHNPVAAHRARPHTIELRVVRGYKRLRDANGILRGQGMPCYACPACSVPTTGKPRATKGFTSPFLQAATLRRLKRAIGRAACGGRSPALPGVKRGRGGERGEATLLQVFASSPLGRAQEWIPALVQLGSPAR